MGLDKKIAGGAAELGFATEAIRRGLIVSRPMVDAYPYDFIVQPNLQTFYRVQVRSTARKNQCGGTGFIVSLAHTSPKGPTRYTAKEIDVMAVYCTPRDAWYFIPVKRITKLTGMNVNPEAKVGWAETFRDNWKIFK